MTKHKRGSRRSEPSPHHFSIDRFTYYTYLSIINIGLFTRTFISLLNKLKHNFDSSSNRYIAFGFYTKSSFFRNIVANKIENFLILHIFKVIFIKTIEIH